MTGRSRFFTTPIFYVNANPHIGHLYSMVLGDVAHRWSLFTGTPSILSTGTDEHGMKVAAAARKANISPQQFVNGLSEQFKRLAKVAGINYERFIRTTDPDHILEAKKLWQVLDSRGMIYEGKHKGWYCISDECFYPESELIRERDGQLISRESGNKVEWTEEINYFFRLSSLQPLLRQWLEHHSEAILPRSRYEQIVRDLESEPLVDLSISRPVGRSPWGIPVPGDNSQTMYVWFEALVNYLTVNKSAGGKWWPATHIIGKDIMRFHTVYWPAFLIGAGIEPPRKVVVHGHWTLEGTKMSKSRQNVVDPFEAIERFGRDTVRYVLIHDSSLAHDSPFSFPRLVERHNINLVNKFGNLVSRVCGPKFDIRESLSQLPSIDDPSELLDRCRQLAEQFEFGRVAQVVNKMIMDANTSFQDAAPWSQEDPRLAVACAAEKCRIAALLLQPICPLYSKQVLDKLKVSSDRRTSQFAIWGSDLDYGQNGKGGHIFKKLVEKPTITV